MLQLGVERGGLTLPKKEDGAGDVGGVVGRENAYQLARNEKDCFEGGMLVAHFEEAVVGEEESMELGTGGGR